METKPMCDWCGATDQNLLVMSNEKVACEDWHACAERELRKGAQPVPEPFQLPWGRTVYVESSDRA